MLDAKLLDRLVKTRRASKDAEDEKTAGVTFDRQVTSVIANSTPSRADVFAIIARSGLFDADYYRQANQGVEGTEKDLLEHFLDVGCSSNCRPNPYFEPYWYVQTYPDVSASGMQPVLHYILHGDMEDRWPGPLFNTPWFRKKHQIPKDILALAHYLAARRQGTLSPLPEFDIAYYARNNPDVISAHIDPFEHFVSYGYQEGRNPSPEFDVKWYANEYLSGSLAQNPFYHWLSHRGQPGVYGHFPEDQPTIAREVKRFTRPAPEFEELQPLPQTAIRRAKVLAYYLPQFHAFMENDAWWGTGFTEWTNIARGLPRFVGHYQPRIPRDLGFYKLDKDSVAETMRRQVALAKKGGVHGFVFYHYWFNGKRLMAGPLDYLLSDPAVDLPFSLMWANENWTRRWDGAESEVLISQDYRDDDDDSLVADFARHFADPRYIRLNGRPLFMIYRPGIIPDAKAKVERWRSLFQSRFGERPIIVMAQAFGDNSPTLFGLDGAFEFPPHKLTQHMPPINHGLTLLDPDFTGKAYSYENVMRQSLEEAEPNYPLIKAAVPSWDNDARRQGAGLVITGSTPALYESWLSQLVDRAVRTPFFGEPVVCINAWNEWCEGTYLEPDLHFGAAYLNATGRAVTGLTRRDGMYAGRLLLVGHDAFPGGAQTLLLKIGELLTRNHGVRLEYLLLDGGRLVPQYKELAPTTVLDREAGLDTAIAEFAGRGFDHAIVNSTAAGYSVTALSNLGKKPLLLVHELPRILREKNLSDAARRGLKDARLAVFAARFVRDALFEEFDLAASDTAETLILPQGSYSAIEVSQQRGQDFRREMGVDQGEALILGMGYADLRKGFDIFLQLWRMLNRDQRVHFCWLGDTDPGLHRWLAEEIQMAKGTGTFHMPGQIVDVSPALSAANAFVLPSREDPFPTVVLEALAAGLPVVAFHGAGGIPEILVGEGVGIAVPYGDAPAMAAALQTAIQAADPVDSAKRQELVQGSYSFSSYVARLLYLAMPQLPKVSVVVPNYNYARYLPERLGSIFRQSHPVHEILVLDDCSSDDSLTVISGVAADWKRKVDLCANQTNSGSVFAQWRKAAEISSGDWVWLAEADDSSESSFLAEIFSAIQQDPNVMFAFSDSCTILEDGSPQWESYKSYYATVEPDALTRTEIFDAASFASRFLSVKNLLLNVSAVVWRRTTLLQALDAAGEELKRFRMAGDWRLYLEALAAPGARVAYVSLPLNIHRRHSVSVTHSLDATTHIAEIQACQAFFRSMFSPVSHGLGLAQSDYLKEVTEQLLATATSQAN